MQRLLFCTVVVAMLSATAHADVFNMGPGLKSLEFVPVGDAGNTPDTEVMTDDTTGYGSVAEAYLIGKYEVTAGQYTEFLNKVAGIDTYGLYNTSMGSSDYGCKIERFEGEGTLADPYQYQVADDRADRPVNYVSWGDAARFANWLHNGQPTGTQGDSTTEDGAYFLNGAISDSALLAIRRESDATWFIPTENEWYKAAYYDPTDYDPDGAGGIAPGAGYWDYPTSNDTAPINTLPDPGNHANFDAFYGTGNDSYTIGSPYYRTEVGEFQNSASPYGTFDQGGNLWEWNETLISPTRGVRGGGWDHYSDRLHASYRDYNYPTRESDNIGFRVASIPEPSTFALLAMGALALLAYAWRRRTRTT